MSDSIKWLLWILGLILLLWLGIGVDSCRENSWEPILCANCAENATEENVPAVVAPPVAETRLPVDFSLDNSTAFTNPGYDDYRTRILEGYKEGQILEITGDYFEGELPPEGFDNMGIARAAAIRDLLVPDIPAENILLKSNLIDVKSDDKYFSGHSYRWVSEQPKSVEVVDDCTTIRFDFNSADGNLNAEILARLDEIAQRVRKTGEKITITGHTDDVGDEDMNMSLGRKRAMDIRREFINRRVLREQIDPTSRGESEPIASNDSDRGRAENRRVEVCLSE
jgi:outer membrane protein OmpA-like peptidoglycan-associated protein